MKKEKQMVVEWLRDGGKPTAEIPFGYNYCSATAKDGEACAGAALAYLTGLEGASEAGKHLFGDANAFFDFTPKIGDPHDVLLVADYLENLT